MGFEKMIIKKSVTLQFKNRKVTDNTVLFRNLPIRQWKNSYCNL